MIPGLAAKGFHVYALDLLGYGRSARPDVDYSISLEETVVLQFLDAKRLAKTDVGGWSMGGWIAMKLALDHPERVDRLIVYDSAGLYFPPRFDAELFAPADEAGLYHLMAMLVVHPVRLPGFAARDALRKLQRNKWIVDRSMASMTSGRDLLDFRLGGLRQPMLIMWGAEDRLTPVSEAETMHRLVPHSILKMVPGCGHMAPAECPGPVIGDTVEFLKANPPMRP
jgi:pimeloyl-ACP methyl ester carboxylesterase